MAGTVPTSGYVVNGSRREFFFRSSHVGRAGVRPARRVSERVRVSRGLAECREAEG